MSHRLTQLTYRLLRDTFCAITNRLWTDGLLPDSEWRWRLIGITARIEGFFTLRVDEDPYIDDDFDDWDERDDGENVHVHMDDGRTLSFTEFIQWVDALERRS